MAEVEIPTAFPAAVNRTTAAIMDVQAHLDSVLSNMATDGRVAPMAIQHAMERLATALVQITVVDTHLMQAMTVEEIDALTQTVREVTGRVRQA